MSHHSQSAAPQPHPPSGHFPSHPELAERIQRFQEATQALLSLYEASAQQYPAAPHEALEPGNAGPPHYRGSRDNGDEPSGETRSYYLSPSTLRQERELLHKYRAEDFRALLAETHTLLVGLVKIMKSTHPDARLRGYVVSSLGCLLEQAATLTLRMRNVYSAMKRV